MFQKLGVTDYTFYSVLEPHVIGELIRCPVINSMSDNSKLEYLKMMIDE